MVDRFTRWPEAIPIVDITADTVAKTFYSNWIARFGSPKIVTTEQGSQFESALYNALLQLVGGKRIRTTAYYPAANGLVERWHRTMKAAIMCHQNENWVKLLPTVLLGLRSCYKEDLKASPAEYLYGTTLRIHGEFFTHEDPPEDPNFFLEDFRIHMREVKPAPAAHHCRRKTFCYKELNTCSHVFLRLDHVKRPLEQPYSGPHKVISRTDDSRTFTIEVNGKEMVVNVERLKPAHLATADVFEDPDTTSQNVRKEKSSSQQAVPTTLTTPSATAPADQQPSTSSNANSDSTQNQVQRLQPVFTTFSESLRTYPARKKQVHIDLNQNHIFQYSPAPKPLAASGGEWCGGKHTHNQTTQTLSHTIYSILKSN